MIRVLLVDDEPIVRIALRELISWERFGCEIASEASNGREALKRIEEGTIDLVLVDMQMPLMSGIEFIKELSSKDASGRIVVIVLSAYSDYEYVREAFLYGACDYVIKNDLEESKVAPVIQKAVELIQAKWSETERKEQEARSVRQNMQEQWLLRAVQPVSPEVAGAAGTAVSGRERTEALESWRRAMDVSGHCLGCLLLDRMYGRPRGIQDQQSRFVMHTVRQVVEGYGYEIVIAPLSVLEYAILVFIPAKLGGQAFRSLFSEMMNKALSHLQQYVDVSGAVGLAEPSQRRDSWSDRYRQAVHLARLRFFQGSGQVFFPESMPMLAQNRPQDAVWSIPRLIREMEQGNTDWEEELEAGLKQMGEVRLMAVETVLQPYQALLWELGTLLKSQGLEWRQITDEEETPVIRLEYMNSAAEINEYIHSLSRQVARAVHPAHRMAETVPRMVDKVKQWIDRYYSEPLSLTGASEMAGISENYLSKIFAKEMGETFIEYVARKRIESAIQMMKSGMKLYEIGEKVGYPNQGHFTKVFKRVTGQTPLEYRESLR